MSIKPVDRDSTVSVVWPMDPGIDTEKSKLVDYVEASSSKPASWRDLLVAKDGAKLTEFVVGVIQPSELCAIEDECRPGSDKAKPQTMLWRVFCASLRDIKNGPAMEGTDAQGRKAMVVPKVNRDGLEYVDPHWLSNVFGGGLKECAIFVGSVAWFWNKMGDRDAKNS